MNPLFGFALLGLVAGFASGCFGIGGGIIMVPVLVLLFKIDYHVAVGTSLALILPISLAGSATNFSLGKINWSIFWACALAGAVGAVVGALLIQKIPALYAKRSFAVLLVYAAARLWIK
ncbi:MAG: sulfite exporter TauE/SafE family protein [Opitutaceae bacterium]|nr:sulfite exporter TauE/SafE family protein [Opitutaceae bacterium]